LLLPSKPAQPCCCCCWCLPGNNWCHSGVPGCVTLPAPTSLLLPLQAPIPLPAAVTPLSPSRSAHTSICASAAAAACTEPAAAAAAAAAACSASCCSAAPPASSEADDSSSSSSLGDNLSAGCRYGCCHAGQRYCCCCQM
jgi:hypothetical protein